MKYAVPFERGILLLNDKCSAFAELFIKGGEQQIPCSVLKVAVAYKIAPPIEHFINYENATWHYGGEETN